MIRSELRFYRWTEPATTEQPNRKAPNMTLSGRGGKRAKNPDRPGQSKARKTTRNQNASIAENTEPLEVHQDRTVTPVISSTAAAQPAISSDSTSAATDFSAINVENHGPIAVATQKRNKFPAAKDRLDALEGHILRMETWKDSGGITAEISMLQRSVADMKTSTTGRLDSLERILADQEERLDSLDQNLANQTERVIDERGCGNPVDDTNILSERISALQQTIIEQGAMLGELRDQLEANRSFSSRGTPRVQITVEGRIKTLIREKMDEQEGENAYDYEDTWKSRSNVRITKAMAKAIHEDENIQIDGEQIPMDIASLILYTAFKHKREIRGVDEREAAQGRIMNCRKARRVRVSGMQMKFFVSKCKRDLSIYFSD